MISMAALPADFEIRPLRQPEEAAEAATWMARSEPWLTLRRDRETCLKLLLEPNRELHAGVAGGRVIGVLALDLAGLLNGYIAALAVHPDWRCGGVGTRLIQFAEERILRQSPNVFLCVSSFNLHARRLYARLGYEPVGELRDFVVRGHSELLMRKTTRPWSEV
jgi:ribosomal protein S18 acetylase RimI-like enzyme